MKGIVFNLLEELVSDEHGEETWDALIDAAGVDGGYTSLGNYQDAELVALVGAASAALDTPGDDIVRWFGHGAIPMFYERYPQLFDGHTDTISFLRTLNDIIHPEVRKLYPGADVPTFEYQGSGDSSLTMGYHSSRGLCALGEGLIQGAAKHYGQNVEIARPACTKRGDPKCVFEVAIS